MRAILMLKVKLLVTLFALSAGFSASATNISISDFEQFGITAKAEKLTHARLGKLEFDEDKYYLKVRLGRLSPKQFNDMRALYLNKSQVKYDANREYELIDFLYPAIQATVDRVFITASYVPESIYDLEVDDESDDGMTVWALRKNGASLFTNCWNTTIEVLRSIGQSFNGKYRIYWPSRDDVTISFKDPSLRKEVTEQELQPGDVMAVFKKDFWNLESEDVGTLQHTALILSRSLVFEKTDTSDNDAYRISFRKDVIEKYNEVFEDKERVVSYLRFNKNSSDKLSEAKPSVLSDELTPETLKHLKVLAPNLIGKEFVAGCEQGLGGGCDVIFSHYLEFDLMVDPQTGRGVLRGDPKELLRFEKL